MRQKVKKSGILLRMSFFLCTFAAAKVFENKTITHMKKFYTLAAVLLCAVTLYAETVKIDGLYYSLGNTTAQLVKDQSSDQSVYKEYTSVTIPASITYNAYTYPVTSLGTSAFEGCSNLQSVTLPASVTSLGTDAFYGCVKLGSVNLEEGLTTIGQRAFYNCNLSVVTIPSTVTSIGNKAFSGCPLTTVTWLPPTCSIGTDDSAPFYSTSSQITSFTFGNQVETIPAYLCKNMSKLETVVIPPSVTSLGQYAFMYCTSLKSINLPVTQKTLPVSFFEGCTALETIELPATLITISQDAFYGCTSLKEINLHEGLTTIGQRAFYNCKLTSVTIPSTITSMGNKAFVGCPLTSVTWKPVTCSIGSDDSAPFYSTSSKITKFTFGDQVETIPAYLCKNMSLIDTIVLPPSVSSLGQYAFMYCTSLKSINLPVTQKTLPISFLEGCTALETIELPATLITVSQDAFYGCTSLKEINLHEGLTTIGQRAFYNCKLTSVTIPSTITSMGNKAFVGCPLTSVTWNPVSCSIGSEDSAPFYSTSSKITKFTFGDKVESIPSGLCNSMSQLDTIVLPKSVTSIGQSAFKSCSMLKGVSIPASVTSIGSSAFIYCTSLKSLTFPEGIKTVATSVLEGCTALQTVVIPESVTTINQDAFYNCAALKAIYNYALTPQTITERAVQNVDKKTCILYVPMDYIDLYKAKAVWCDFLNIIGVSTGLHFEEQTVQLSYLKQDDELLYMEPLTLQVPVAPKIDGFTFLKWEVQSGDLKDGIVLKAVYTANDPTGAPKVYVNPANPAQKLIREGQVYVLRDDKLYTIQGQAVR